jgi:hypothetical protein
MARRPHPAPTELASIERALTDPTLLGAALGNDASWCTWLIVLKAAFGLNLSDEQRATFVAVAGRRAVPTKRVRELWCAIGRRGGKSRIAAAIACYLALFVQHQLARGEQGMVLVLAASTAQAKIVFNYCLGFLESSPLLRDEVLSTTRFEIRLRNGIVIATHTSSFRTIRGRTLVATVLDEVGFWFDDATARPDIETYRALLPALLTTNGMMVGISSPYRRSGLLYNKHKASFGVDDPDVLVVQGSSQTFNPLLSDAAIAAQRAADPIAAASEWDAEFRTDLVSFLDEALVEACIDHSRPLELPPSGQRYQAFVDASGGAIGGDAYTIAIGHKEGAKLVVDVIRGKRGPFDPTALTQDYAELAKEYGVREVTGDHYAAAWVSTAWKNTGLAYKTSEINASQIYLEALPTFTRNLAVLPNYQPLIRELLLLERSPQRSGKDQVTHPRNCHDDYANSCCGLLALLGGRLAGWASLSAEARQGVLAWASRPQLVNTLEPNVSRYAPLLPRMSTTPPASAPFPRPPPPPEPELALDQALHTPDRPHHFVDTDFVQMALEADLARASGEREEPEP